MTNRPFETQDLRKIAEKWAEFHIEERTCGDRQPLSHNILSAIDEATTVQHKVIEDLEAANERLRGRVKELGEFIAKLPRSCGISPWNDGHSSAIQIIEQKFASLFMPLAKSIPPTENRPAENEQIKVKDTDLGSEK